MTAMGLAGVAVIGLSFAAGHPRLSALAAPLPWALAYGLTALALACVVLRSRG